MSKSDLNAVEHECVIFKRAGPRPDAVNYMCEVATANILNPDQQHVISRVFIHISVTRFSAVFQLLPSTEAHVQLYTINIHMFFCQGPLSFNYRQAGYYYVCNYNE